MSESDREWILFWGATVSSSLYLAGLFAVGILSNEPNVVRLVLATLGIVYLCNIVQSTAPQSRASAVALCALSILTGAAAGVTALVGG